jgi:hypothetical protein
MRSVRLRCLFPPSCRPGERRRSVRPPPLRAVFSFVRASSSRHPCLRAPAWAGRGKSALGVNQLRPRNVWKTDQARQHLEALGEAMKETDATTRAEMGRFHSAQRTPAYSLPAHAYPRACPLPVHGHALCQSCTRVSKGVGFQSLRAHALEMRG